MVFFKHFKNLVFAALLFSISFSNAQDKLKKMPGYEQYTKMAPKIRTSVKSGAIDAEWHPNGNAFEYNKDGKRILYDVIIHDKNEIGDAVYPDWRAMYTNRPQRGRQFASVDSPDGKLKAYTKDRNMYFSNSDGTNVSTITTEGYEENQIKYGIATWVYGKELGQNTAMWWSPGSKKNAFYRFDEKEALKYYVLYNQTKIQDSVEIEAYPKVGAKNLPVDLIMYDLATKTMITLDTRDGKPYHDGDLGTYLYDISWTPDGKELLYHSTNRKQNIMELRAADPRTGKSRNIVREEWCRVLQKTLQKCIF